MQILCLHVYVLEPCAGWDSDVGPAGPAGPTSRGIRWTPALI